MPTAHLFWSGKEFALTTEELPRRQLAPHEVRVAVHAISLNYRDLLISRGEYPAPTGHAIVPCSDGSGTVLEVGADVGDIFRVGDAVVGSFFPNWWDGAASREKTAVTVGCDIHGWLAEEIILPAYALVHIPSGMSFTTAACAPCAGVTAWVGLVELSKLSPGQTVLIQGTGGVATWTAKLAEAHGLKVILITSDVSKAVHLHPDSLGVINYRERPNWSNEVLELTNGHGADFILELGGNSSIQESLRAAAYSGHIALIGGLGGWTYGHIDSLQLIAKAVTTHGIYVGSKRSLEELLRFSADASIAPHVSSIFSFDDAHHAFSELAAGRAIGKIVIDVNRKI